ncbi:MAG: hypothetical protein JXO49_10715 [Deltaproteobacteria bacterium]|nr:hypothetical protein [Candidatus Anaeroferrophillus wilburensis]MBN2889804.1 hypothetical protein [Deltaproteobacteria bacterium]
MKQHQDNGQPAKKHPCPDCRFCQWCSDDRCRLCRGECPSCGRHGDRKLSLVEQIERYNRLNKDLLK